MVRERLWSWLIIKKLNPKVLFYNLLTIIRILELKLSRITLLMDS